jgi:aryl-phospho-beta-D-glucosidase BglC (GH1 family)
MKQLFSLLFALAALHAGAQSQMELTATEVAKLMAPGWNLGNTMEAGDKANNFTNKGGLKAETAWQDTKTTQAIIDYVRKQGFRSIRIPCAWVMGHISNAETYEIDAQWMARVKELVDYSLKAGLYVVINQHWDGGWLENHIKEATLLPKNKAILTAIWTQIANTFKDYDERLLFAGLNEPNAETQSATNNLLEYEQTFINVVRQTGGNNAQRILIIQGPSTNIDHTCNFMTTLPKDPTADRLMVEVHYYAPWQWWGMEKDESWGKVFYYWGEGNHVSGSQHNATHSEEGYVEEELEKMKKQFGDMGIPVYIGEFGANWRTMPAGENQQKHNASIQTHYRVVVQKAMEKGMVPVIWDTNYRGMPSMTIINRKDLSIYNHYMLDGIHEAMEAVGIPVTALDKVQRDAMIMDDRAYDLQGRYLASSAPKGIYVQNGKKRVAQ